VFAWRETNLPELLFKLLFQPSGTALEETPLFPSPRSPPLTETIESSKTDAERIAADAMTVDSHSTTSVLAAPIPAQIVSDHFLP
jgi:hypothetical protein